MISLWRLLKIMIALLPGIILRILQPLSRLNSFNEFGRVGSLELASLTAFSLLTGNLQGKTCALGRYWLFSANLVLDRTKIQRLTGGFPVN